MIPNSVANVGDGLAYSMRVGLDVMTERSGVLCWGIEVNSPISHLPNILEQPQNTTDSDNEDWCLYVRAVLVPFYKEALEMILDVEPGTRFVHDTSDALITINTEEESLKVPDVSIVERQNNAPPVAPPDGYRPMTPDAQPLRDPKQFRFGQDQQYKVVEVVDERTLRLGRERSSVAVLPRRGVGPAGS